MLSKLADFWGEVGRRDWVGVSELAICGRSGPLEERCRRFRRKEGTGIRRLVARLRMCAVLVALSGTAVTLYSYGGRQ
jgi:hypothetical protein